MILCSRTIGARGRTKVLYGPTSRGISGAAGPSRSRIDVGARMISRSTLQAPRRMSVSGTIGTCSRSMGKAAKQCAKELFDKDVTNQKMDELFEAVIKVHK